MKEKKTAFIGCGRAGSKLAYQLARSGYIIEALFDLNDESAHRLAGMTGSGKVCKSAAEAASCCDTVFISTPDGIIEKICNEAASAGGFRKNQFVFHLSGSLHSSILSAAAEKGVFTGSLHPLQSLAGENSDINPFKGVLAAVEGCPQAVEAAKKIAMDIGAQPYEIDGNAKTLYHASAVIASNYLVSLMKMASEVMAASGIPKEKAVEFLIPLVRGTISNIEAMGVEKALTGPVARGDTSTIKAHLNALEQKVPHFRNSYMELARIALKAAEEERFIPDTIVSEMKKLLEP